MSGRGARHDGKQESLLKLSPHLTRDLLCPARPKKQQRTRLHVLLRPHSIRILFRRVKLPSPVSSIKLLRVLVPFHTFRRSPTAGLSPGCELSSSTPMAAMLSHGASTLQRATTWVPPTPRRRRPFPPSQCRLARSTPRRPRVRLSRACSACRRRRCIGIR